MPNYLQRVAAAGASITSDIKPFARGAPVLPPSPAVRTETRFETEEPPEQSTPVPLADAAPSEIVTEVRPTRSAPPLAVDEMQNARVPLDQAGESGGVPQKPAEPGDLAPIPPPLPFLDTVVGATPTTVVRLPRTMRTCGATPVASEAAHGRAEEGSTPSPVPAPTPTTVSFGQVHPVEAPAPLRPPALAVTGVEALPQPGAPESIPSQAPSPERSRRQPEMPGARWIEKARPDVSSASDPSPVSPVPVEAAPRAATGARPPEVPVKPVTDTSPAPAPNVFPTPFARDHGERRVISIGQVAVEVYNDPPLRQAPRPVEPRVAAMDPLEARFLGRLRWKL